MQPTRRWPPARRSLGVAERTADGNASPSSLRARDRAPLQSLPIYYPSHGSLQRGHALDRNEADQCNASPSHLRIRPRAPCRIAVINAPNNIGFLHGHTVRVRELRTDGKTGPYPRRVRARAPHHVGLIMHPTQRWPPARQPWARIRYTPN